VGARGGVILALVEEGPGLLPGERRDAEAHAVLHHLQLARLGAVEHAGGERQTFEGAHAHVVALDDRARREFLDEQPDELGLQALRALRERLHDEHVRVAVDDERRQEVALRVDEAEGVGLLLDAGAARHGRAQASAPPFAADLLVPRREDADGDLGAVAVERAPDEAAALVAQGDDRAARRPAVVPHVAAVHPEVPAPRALRALPRDGDLRLVHITVSSFELRVSS
jgi:hypothetical protein